MPNTVFDHAIAIAQNYTLEGNKKAFNKCERYSALLHQELRRAGIDARRVNGAFHPNTPSASWNIAWQKLNGVMGLGFRHYWVVVEDTIIDTTAAQFGYQSLVIAKENDKRYSADQEVDGEADFLPLGIRKQENSICHFHSLKEIAQPLSHTVKIEETRFFICGLCAVNYNAQGYKVKELVTRKKAA